MAIRYEADNITRVRYEARQGQRLTVVAEAVDNRGDSSIFEVKLGVIERFKVDGVEVIKRTKRGPYKDAPNQMITWNSLRSGDAIVKSLNGRGGLVRRLGTF